jgi:hypothetical protein
MSAAFETREDASDERLRPLRVAIRPDQTFESACEMAADLPGWSVASCDPVARVLVCRKPGGFLGGVATITIRCEGPADLPSTTVHVRSTSEGGLLARDRAHVLEFLTPFIRRVC